MRVVARAESWSFRTPFEIARGVQTTLPVVHVVIEDGGFAGQGEAAGVDYDGETIESILDQIADAVAQAGDDLSCETIQTLLPGGGARNALDCALWDLAAKKGQTRVWQLAGRSEPRPLITACTIGLGDAATVAARAAELADWPLIKIKLDADRHVNVVETVRAACPHSKLIVDPNQSWTIDQLNQRTADLTALGVGLIEQPLPVGHDDHLAKYRGAIPIAADESCTDRASLVTIAHLYQVVNIKLDKTGGLTEALALADAARAQGLGLMVGCMAGTSLAMAPAALVALDARFVDLDGPLLHSTDRTHAIVYDRGLMQPPEHALWG